MTTEVILRKFGNSTGVTFSPALLKELGLEAGCTLSLDSVDGSIKLTPKRKFKLADMIAQCDLKAAPPADLAAWDSARPVGQEVL